ncbi:MAG: M48 family peptidase [Rhodospirillales bacterium]|nr:M48 family peptidase [Rhodospirillales bacterium]
MKRTAKTLALLLIVSLALPSGAMSQSQPRISFLRDAETENTIRIVATPLFRAAGLSAEGVRVFLVNDKSLNAFVAGGQNLFLNTGLLMRAEDVGQLIGVIAHETGHIAGGHLSRTHSQLQNTAAASILAMVLGAGVGAATGRGDVGTALILGGQSSSIRSFLQYSRDQEGQADQAAFSFLDKTGQSARGLFEFLKILEDQELLNIERQDPYLRTHPITQERVQAAAAHIARSPNSNAQPRPEYDAMFQRVRAKLFAYIESVPTTLARYKDGDPRVEARYARAFAYYRKPDLGMALPLIDGLIQESPNDPYFHELKGQMLFENGRAAEALPAYEKAVSLLPNNALLRRDLAHVQIELNDESLLDQAIENLRMSLARERDTSSAWRHLAIAYGRQGKTGLSTVSLAEEALLQGKMRDARGLAERAQRFLEPNTPAWLQAQDIFDAADRRMKEIKDGR